MAKVALTGVRACVDPASIARPGGRLRQRCQAVGDLRRGQRRRVAIPLPPARRTRPGARPVVSLFADGRSVRNIRLALRLP